MLISLLGIVGLVLSLFVLHWADLDKSIFLDIGEAARQVPSSLDLDTGPQIEVWYAAWAGFVLLGLVVVFVLMSALVRPGGANSAARIVGAIVAGLGAVAQMVTMTQLFKGPPSPQFGAWIGLIGWLVVIVGLLFSAPRVHA